MHWFDVEKYINCGDGMGIDTEPMVLLYHEKHGIALGKIIKWADGDFITVAVGYHGFTFTKFALVGMGLDGSRFSPTT